MQRRRFTTSRAMRLLLGLLVFLEAPRLLRGEASPAAAAFFAAYSRSVESGIEQQHRSPETFLAVSGSDHNAAAARLRRGEFTIEQITPPSGAGVPGAMLHHWRGTAFAPGARAEDFERLLRAFNAYPQHFAPEVVRASAVAAPGDHTLATLRVRQHHVITVVMDTAYDVSFGRLDARHGYSTSRSTRMDEIDAAGTLAERTLSPAEEHGFLWRMNTYWSFEERDGGLYLQLESVSLTRSVPRGLGWVMRPYIESIPRESLEFTLRSACNALRK